MIFLSVLNQAVQMFSLNQQQPTAEYTKVRKYKRHDTNLSLENIFYIGTSAGQSHCVMNLFFWEVFSKGSP